MEGLRGFACPLVTGRAVASSAVDPLLPPGAQHPPVWPAKQPPPAYDGPRSEGLVTWMVDASDESERRTKEGIAALLLLQGGGRAPFNNWSTTGGWGQIFLRTFGRSKIFSGTVGANSFKLKVFFGL